jgi:hypothetical protein
VSKIKLLRGKSINLPVKLEQRFDTTGNEMAIEKFSDDVLQEIINPIKDYEVAKFIHDYNVNGENGLDLSFDLGDGYESQGFNVSELVNITNSVKHSFFKLDFFDSPNRETQKLQFTKIIPMYLSKETPLNEPLDGRTGMLTPEFYSDYLRNNEISDLFIFKNEDTKSIDEFYMGARFFNAKNGDVVRMINSQVTGTVYPKQHYYYKVVIDRTKRTYQVFNYINGVVGDRIGNNGNPILFYEMP